MVFLDMYKNSIDIILKKNIVHLFSKNIDYESNYTKSKLCKCEN
jgi:hypothetical protein